VLQTDFMAEEIPLGGNIAGAIRIGDTVRRRAGSWTPAIHALLRHLENVGFDGVPRAVGVDERGREVLSYIPGDPATVSPPPMSHVIWGDTSLVAAAKLLRRYHDALDDFVPPSGATWQMPSDETETICHNDVGPPNTIFRGGEVVAMVDFDQAGPGRRIWDVAVGAWRWVPLSERAEQHPRDRARRLRVFCDAYGLGDERRMILDVLIARIRAIRELARKEVARGHPGYTMIWNWSANGSFLLGDIAYVEAHRDQLSRDL
jgi:hypothetical protein